MDPSFLILTVVGDNRLYTSFHDALWETIVPLNSVLELKLYIWTALQIGGLYIASSE